MVSRILAVGVTSISKMVTVIDVAFVNKEISTYHMMPVVGVMMTAEVISNVGVVQVDCRVVQKELPIN